MFLLSRRQAHAVLAGATATAAYLAGAELSDRKPVRVGGLLALSSLAFAGMVTAKASAKAYSAHKRIDLLVPTVAGKYDKSGGTISGSVTVTGDHHIQGSLYGSGGTITAGDALHVVSNDFTADGTITAHTNLGVDGHASANTYGPGGTRANLGAGATLAQCQARIDYILGTLLVDAGISW